MASPKPAGEIVYIVDDDAAVSDALGMLMQAEGIHFQTLPSAEAFLEQYRPGRPSCLILDIGMPGMSGMELQGRLQSLGYDIPIIFITGHGDIPMAVQAIQNGAQDFLQKPFRNEDLLKRIRASFARAHNDSSGAKAANQPNQGDAKAIGALTGREREVLDCIVEGLSNKATARKLKISARTVETHRANLMQKLRVHSVAELVKVALAISDPA